MTDNENKPRDPFYGRVPYNILLIRMSALGDILFALPAIKALLKRYPKTKFYWAIDEWYESLLTGFSELYGVLPFNRPEVTQKLKSLERFWKAVGLILAYIKLVRGIKFVGSICFQPLFRSSLLAYLSAARIRIGYKRWAESGFFMQNYRVKVPKNIHIIEQNLALISPTGTDIHPERVKIPLEKADFEVADKFMKDHDLTKDHMMILYPGASHKKKQWTLDNYAQLLDMIQEQHELVPVIVWGKQGLKMAKEIQHDMKTPAIIAPDLNLRQMAAFFDYATYMVAPDTGPMHLANTMGTPVVGLYAPTDPKVYGPYWQPSKVVAATGKKKKMSEIKVEEVFTACDELYHELNEMASETA